MTTRKGSSFNWEKNPPTDQQQQELQQKLDKKEKSKNSGSSDQQVCSFSDSQDLLDSPHQITDSSSSQEFDTRNILEHDWTEHHQGLPVPNPFALGYPGLGTQFLDSFDLESLFNQQLIQHPNQNSNTEMASPKLCIAPFSGEDDSIKFNSWVNMLDLYTSSTATDIEKIRFLGTHLTKRAQVYFADAIAPWVFGPPALTYDQVKDLMKARFATAILDPLYEAQQRYLRRSEDVETYFNDKMFLLRQTNLPDESVVVQLTAGMPTSYKDLLGIQTNPTDWLKQAKKMENNRTNNKFHSKSTSSTTGSTSTKSIHITQDSNVAGSSSTSRIQSNNRRQGHRQSQLTQQQRRLPRCFFCKFLNKTAFHLHKDCPHRPRDDGSTQLANEVQESESNDQDISTATSHHITQLDNQVYHFQDTIDIKTLKQAYDKFINFRVLVNGTPTQIIADSASDVNIMSLRKVKQLNLDIDNEHADEVTAFDHMMISLGRVKFNMVIGNKAMVVYAQVVRNFIYGLLLEINTLGKFNVWLETSTKQAHLLDPVTNQFTCLHVLTTPNHAIDPRIGQLISKYSNCFASHASDVGIIDYEQHRIRLKQPHNYIYVRPYRRSLAHQQEIDRQVKMLLDKGFIRESKSPWAFGTTLVPKKDGSQRMCHDYRPLNSITIPDRYPLPHIQEIIDQLQGMKIFSVLDLKWGYWHIQMHPDDIEKTAFVTSTGHYEYLVMPFGLRNAPASFQRCVKHALGNLFNNGAINYLDDVIVYSKDMDSHVKLLEEVFNRLEQHHIKLNKTKCTFGVNEVEYLGFIIKDNTVTPSTKKLKAILEYPEPKDKSQINQFMGLANQFSRFIKNFTSLIQPISDLRRKDVPWHWIDKQQQSFDKLKRILTTAPVLAIFDPEVPVELHTDACKIGIAGVLIQNSHPVAYFSKRLNQHQENYSASELECLAVVEAVEHFDAYLSGNKEPFKIITDHQAIENIFMKAPLKSIYFRWSRRLSPYDFNIYHRSGKLMQHVDALSRNPVVMFITRDDIIKSQNALIKSSTVMFLTKSDILQAQQSSSQSIPSNVRQIGEILYRKHKGIKKTFIPSSLIQQLLREAHDDNGHPGFPKTFNMINSAYYWPNMQHDIHYYVKTCHLCQISKSSRNKLLGHLKPLETALTPLEIVSMDTIVIGKAASGTKAKYVQVIIDHFSRYLWAYVSSKDGAAANIDALSRAFPTKVKPRKLITDNKKNYRSTELKNFCKNNKVIHVFTSTYHPQSNGMVEKVNHTIKERLKLALQTKPNFKWSSLLVDIVKQYNNTQHSVTKFQPAFLFNGKSEYEITPLSEAQTLAIKRTNTYKMKLKQRYDKKHKHIIFKPGDLVKKHIPSNLPSRNKFTPAFEGPFTVVSQDSELNYTISLSGQLYKAHLNQLEPYYSRTSSSDGGK